MSFQVLENRVLVFLFYFCTYFKYSKRKNDLGISVVQWFGLCVHTTKGLGSVLGRGTKMPKAVQCNTPLAPKINLQQETAPVQPCFSGKRYLWAVKPSYLSFTYVTVFLCSNFQHLTCPPSAMLVFNCRTVPS